MTSVQGCLNCWKEELPSSVWCMACSNHASYLVNLRGWLPLLLQMIWTIWDHVWHCRAIAAEFQNNPEASRPWAHRHMNSGHYPTSPTQSQDHLLIPQNLIVHNGLKFRQQFVSSSSSHIYLLIPLLVVHNVL
jgi:hypothetical protein